jgi:hypothetical protein
MLPRNSETLRMNELLANPAVQAGVAPFVAALVVAALLRHTRWVYWSVGAAFLVVVALTMGFAFEPLTSSRKLVLAVLVALLLLPVLDTALPVAGRARSLLLALVGAGLGVWVLSRLLLQKEMLPALLAGGGAALFLAGFLDGAQRGSSGSPLQAAALALVLGLGTGVLALLGASAQLAQIGIAIGAGAGAAGLALLLAPRAPGQGWSLGLLAALVTGLAALLAVFTGQLPWYCLVPLLATPWAARLVREQDSRKPWLTALYTAGAAVIPMLLAVALAWSTAGTSTQVGLPFFLT